MTARLIAGILAAALATHAAAAEPHTTLVAIVSSSQSQTDFTVADLRRVFIGEITRWPDGRRIVPVLLTTQSEPTAEFLKHVVRMSPIDYAQQWIGVVFRGQAAAPPVTVATASEAVRFVAAHADAIAVVPRDAPLPPSVRVATIDHRAPDAPGYGLSW